MFLANIGILLRRGLSFRRSPSSPLQRSLPGELLHRRLVPFRINGITPDTRLPRSFIVLAKHEGAALSKARAWGFRVSSVRRDG